MSSSFLVTDCYLRGRAYFLHKTPVYSVIVQPALSSRISKVLSLGNPLQIFNAIVVAVVVLVVHNKVGMVAKKRLRD